MAFVNEQIPQEVLDSFDFSIFKRIVGGHLPRKLNANHSWVHDKDRDAFLIATDAGGGTCRCAEGGYVCPLVEGGCSLFFRRRRGHSRAKGLGHKMEKAAQRKGLHTASRSSGGEAHRIH